MSKLWKYKHFDDSLGYVTMEHQYKTEYVYQESQPEPDYEEVVDKEKINNWLYHNYKDDTDYLIRSLVSPQVSHKHIHDIQYNSELKSDVKLHPEFVFNYCGQLIETYFYYGYVDSSNKGTLVLKVIEEHTMYQDDAGKFPSQQRLHKRIKKRIWADKNGVLNEVNPKKSEKLYDTFDKYNKEGRKRRENIINHLTINVVLSGILSGNFTNQDDGEEKLIDLVQSYAGAFNSYLKTGKGSIYDDIINDSQFSWLSNVIINTPQTQAMVPFMIGLTFRNYIVDKLKGIIK